MYSRVYAHSKLLFALCKSVLLCTFKRSPDNWMDYKLIVLVRTDLCMNKGKIAASCAHASITCYSQTLRRNPLLAIDWERSGQRKIILRFTEGEVGLRRIFQKAKEQKVIAALIRDAGKTQVLPGTVTALGIGPASAEEVAKILPNLKLL